MDKLVSSSPKTREWLNVIKNDIKEKSSSLEYNESKYWASFRSLDRNRKVAYLQPFKNQIRLFVKLPLSFDNELEPAPSSGSWKETYPSIFKIRSEQAIEKAIRLILNSYRFDNKL